MADAQVVKPLGVGLDENAETTVKTWKFKPAMRNGGAVPVKVMVPVLTSFSASFLSPTAPRQARILCLVRCGWPPRSALILPQQSNGLLHFSIICYTTS